MEPLVSIVVPCYNAEPWLAQTLDSALAQTWRATEIVVVDDGSRDRSREITRGYADRGVRLLEQANAGAAAARNAGLRAARGALIQFLDADDLLAPGKIEAQMRRLAEGSPGLLASGAWGRFERDPAEAEFTPHANWRDLGGVEFLQSNFERLEMMHPAAWLAPRPLLERIGPWDESLSLNDDGEYFARAVLAADQIVFCAEARSLYRSNLRASLSGRRDRRAFESLLRSTELTVLHLLAADASARSRAAAAYAWKWAAFEVYPAAPDLADRAEEECRRLGGSRRPFPGSGRFQLLARLLGWRAARRLTAPR